MWLPGLRRLLRILEVVGVEVTELGLLGDLRKIHVGVCKWLVFRQLGISVFGVDAEGRVRLQLSESFRLDVERGTHRTIVNLLRTTDDECSPVLFSLNGSDVEVTVLLQVYREDRLLLVIDFYQVCAFDEA